LGDDTGRKGSTLPLAKSVTHVIDRKDQKRIPNGGSAASFGNEDAFTDMYS
jgi:hypothetical protein